MHVSRTLSVIEYPPMRPTLPNGMERDGFVALIDAVAASLGVGAAAMMTFRTMIAATRPSAFKRGPDEPCCYLSQSEIAQKRAVTVGRIREHEAVLERARLIEKRTMANGARSGFSGCGIFFGVAIGRAAELRSFRDEIEADRRTHGRLRGLRSSHQRHLKGLLCELINTLGKTAEVQEIVGAFATWPSAQALHRMSLDTLRAHEAKAERLTIAASNLLHQAQKWSARPLENERSHIQDTTQDSNEVVCNGTADIQGVGKPIQSDAEGDPLHGNRVCREENAGVGSDAYKSKVLQNLGSERLYSLCSDAMKMWLDIERQKRCVLDFHSFVLAAQRRLPELRIYPSVWEQAVERLGEDAAMLCVLITDAKVADPEITILSPGAYLRGMVRAQQTGSLNLMGSLIGLSVRNRRRA